MRIIDGSQKNKALSTFRRTLEAKAGEIAKHCPSDLENPTPAMSIGREISLTLEEIHRWRHLQEDLHRKLIRSECYVETERMQMEERMPSYSHYRFAERHKFRQQLAKIEEERRKLIVGHEEKMQSMHQRLLSLLNNHAHIT